MLVEQQFERKNFEVRILKEGLELWRKQKEYDKCRKLKEQNELKEMLEKWPFEHSNYIKPRGLRNLRLEGLFPDKDYQNAKRFVGSFEFGRPGGGAPLLADNGKKLTRTREDPLLRFGNNNDLRKCVNNRLRYKMNKQEQEEYKKELDKLVEEKRKLKEKNKLDEQEFDRNQAWSKSRKQKENEERKVREQARKLGEKVKLQNRRKLDPIFYPGKNIGHGRRRLAPLSNDKDNGVELAPILAKQRNFTTKTHRDSTDVTNDRKIANISTVVWNRRDSAYLRELSAQMTTKQQTLKELQVEEAESARQHFSTWESFWGRPGHGAPSSTVKKQRLDRLLYPQKVPITVH